MSDLSSYSPFTSAFMGRSRLQLIDLYSVAQNNAAEVGDREESEKMLSSVLALFQHVGWVPQPTHDPDQEHATALRDMERLFEPDYGSETEIEDMSCGSSQPEEEEGEQEEAWDEDKSRFTGSTLLQHA